MVLRVIIYIQGQTRETEREDIEEDITMKIEFSNREYIFEHGHAPKGFGHWYFTFEGMGRWESGTLTEAKKKVREYIKQVAPADYVGTVYVNIEP